MKPNADTKPVIPKELERSYQVFFIHSIFWQLLIQNNSKTFKKM